MTVIRSHPRPLLLALLALAVGAALALGWFTASHTDGDGNSLTYVLLLLGALTALLAVVVIYVALPKRGA